MKTTDDQELLKDLAYVLANARLVRWGYDKSLDTEDARNWVARDVMGTLEEGSLDLLLGHLDDAGRLLPPGGSTRTEYGLEQPATTVVGIMAIGYGDRAKKWATHEREVTVWPDEGPNDYWARYVTAWTKREKESSSG